MTTEDEFEKLKVKILDAVGEVLYVRANYPEYILLEAKNDDSVIQIRSCLADLHVIAQEFQTEKEKHMFLIHSHKKSTCIIM